MSDYYGSFTVHGARTEILDTYAHDFWQRCADGVQRSDIGNTFSITRTNDVFTWKIELRESISENVTLYETHTSAEVETRYRDVRKDERAPAEYVSGGYLRAHIEYLAADLENHERLLVQTQVIDFVPLDESDDDYDDLVGWALLITDGNLLPEWQARA